MSALPGARAADAPGPPFELPPASTPDAANVQDLVITMSDGNRLFADLLRPEPLEPRPTVVTVTGYNKMALGAMGGEFFANHGYNVLVVDERGTGSSEGFWDSWGSRIQQDYVEILDWIVTQAWSDGTVGATGMSYMGITSLFLAGTGHPAVKAVWADVPMADAYRDVTLHGGNINAAFIPFWLGLVGSLGMLPPSWMGDDPAGALLVLAQHAQAIVEFQGGSVLSFATGDELAYDGPFYRIRSPETYAPNIEVPVAYTGGWFDIFQRGETRLHGALSSLGPDQKKWFMSPIYHVGGNTRWNEMGIGSANAVKLAWFDRWLKDVPNGVESIPSVNLFTMGDDRWQHAERWPLPGTRWEPFHLREGPTGSATSLNDGGLEPGAPSGGGGDVLPHVPLVGLCSRSTQQWSAGLIALGPPCETDNRLTELTSLTYTTQALPQDMEVTGPLALSLWVSVDRPEATLAARVSDVAPDGTSTLITGGWLNASHRALDPERTLWDENGEAVIPFHHFTQEAQEPLETGVPTNLEIEIFGTSHVFKKGHRLRLAISSSDAHAVPPLTVAASSLPGTTTVLHGSEYPSRLLVPLRSAGFATQEVALGDEHASDDDEDVGAAEVLGSAGSGPSEEDGGTRGDARLPLTGSAMLGLLAASAMAALALGLLLLRARGRRHPRQSARAAG